MPQRPWLSSFLSLLVVVVAAVALYPPGEGQVATADDVTPASEALLKDRDTPTDLSATLPQPRGDDLASTPATAPAREPPRPPLNGPTPHLQPPAPPRPLADAESWWMPPPTNGAVP